MKKIKYKKTNEKELVYASIAVFLFLVFLLNCKAALVRAAITDDVQSVESLVADGSDVRDKSGDDQLTALHYAAYYGNPRVLQTLIEKGADVNAADANGYTALHLAFLPFYPGMEIEEERATRAFASKMEAVKILLEKGASVTAKNRQRFTPLHFAVQYAANEKEILSTMIDKAGNLKELDNGVTRGLLFWSIAGKNKELTSLLISKSANVNARLSSDMTLVCYAASAGDPDIVENLARSGADLRAGRGHALPTPLFCASNERVFELLLKKGVDNTVKDARGLVAYELAPEETYSWKVNIWEAAARNDADAIRKFARYGGNVNAAGYYTAGKARLYGVSPMHIAALSNSADVVRALLEVRGQSNPPYRGNDFDFERMIGGDSFQSRCLGIFAPITNVIKGVTAMGRILQSGGTVQEKVNQSQVFISDMHSPAEMARRKGFQAIVTLLTQPGR